MPRSSGRGPKAASNAQKPVLPPSQGRSLTQAILRHLGRLLRAFAVRTIMLWIWAVDAAIWCLLWIWTNPWRSTKTAVNIFFRIATLLSVAYLVYDRAYETEATLSSPVLTANKPFGLIFAITNNSHLFTIRNVRWECFADHIKTAPRTNHIRDVLVVDGSQKAIGPGQSLNVNCNKSGNIFPFGFASDETIAEAVMRIKIAYDTDIFGFLSSHRSPPSTKFTWFTEGGTPQWVKGEFAE